MAVARRRRTNVALIGFMYPNLKETGQELAALLEKKFADTGMLVQSYLGSTTVDRAQEIFRRAESAIISSLSQEKNFVITCSEVAAINPANVRSLKEASRIILLASNPMIVLSQEQIDRGIRGIAGNGPGMMARALDILKVTGQAYAAADIRIDTSGMDTKQVLEAMLRRLRR